MTGAHWSVTGNELQAFEQERHRLAAPIAVVQLGFLLERLSGTDSCAEVALDWRLGRLELAELEGLSVSVDILIAITDLLRAIAPRPMAGHAECETCGMPRHHDFDLRVRLVGPDQSPKHPGRPWSLRVHNGSGELQTPPSGEFESPASALTALREHLEAEIASRTV